jgi:zinc protease
MKKINLSPLNTNSLPGPDDITRIELKNGITVLFRPNPNSLTTSIGGYIQAGSL